MHTIDQLTRDHYFYKEDAPGDIGIYRVFLDGDGQRRRCYVKSEDDKAKARKLCADLNTGRMTRKDLDELMQREDEALARRERWENLQRELQAIRDEETREIQESEEVYGFDY